MKTSSTLPARGDAPIPNGVPKPKTPITLAQRAIGASVLVWIVALAFLCGLVAVLPPIAVPMPFWKLTRLFDITAAWAGLATMIVAAVLAPLFARLDWARVAAWIERHLAALCVAAFTLYAALSFWSYHHAPLAMDEYCPLTQSRTWVSGHGRAWVPPALLDWIMTPQYRGNFFSVVARQGFYTPTYWPGLAILEMPFVALGVPWLCNPFLGALALGAVHRLSFKWSGSREAAAWAWALMLASPVIALNAASFYSMPAHLLFNTFYCLLLLRDDRRGAFFAGLVGGFALVLHNPVPHLAFALPWLWTLARGRRELLGPLALGYLVFALPLGFGWSAFLDSFDASQYARAARASGSAPPFIEMVSRLMQTVTWPGLWVVMARLTGLAKTVVWAVPGLLVVAWLGWRGLKTELTLTQARFGRLLGASLFSTFLVYWLVRYDQGHGWGYRYLHSAWFVLAILGGAFLGRAPVKVRAYFAALCVMSFAVMLPLRAVQVESFVGAHRAQVPGVPATAPVSILFIDDKAGEFTVDLLQNDPFLRDAHWHLRSHGAALNEQLARQYLVEPVRLQSGAWGEMWSGRALRHPGFGEAQALPSP